MAYVEVPDDILDVEPAPLLPDGTHRLQFLKFEDTTAQSGRRMWKLTFSAVDYPDAAVLTDIVLFPALTDSAEDQIRRKREVKAAMQILGVEGGFETEAVVGKVVELPVRTNVPKEGSRDAQYGIQNKIAWPRLHG